MKIRSLADKRARYQVLYARHRAHELGCEASLTPDEWRAVLAQHGGRCFYCRAPMLLVLSHIVPLERGGPSAASNVVPACRSCHSRKLRGDLAEADAAFGLGDATAAARPLTHFWDLFAARCGGEGALSTSEVEVNCPDCLGAR